MTSEQMLNVFIQVLGTIDSVVIDLLDYIYSDLSNSKLLYYLSTPKQHSLLPLNTVTATLPVEHGC